MLDEARGEELIQNRVHFLVSQRTDAVGPRRDGRTVRGNRNLERHQGAGAEVCWGLREHVQELSKDFAQLGDDDRRPTRAVQIKRGFAQV